MALWGQFLRNNLACCILDFSLKHNPKAIIAAVTANLDEDIDLILFAQLGRQTDGHAMYTVVVRFFLEAFCDYIWPADRYFSKCLA